MATPKYTKTVWINGGTRVNAENMNKIENGIEDVDRRLEDTKENIEDIEESIEELEESIDEKITEEVREVIDEELLDELIQEEIEKAVNKIDSVSVNGEEQEIDEDKNVNITVPTKLSDLENDLLEVINKTYSELVALRNSNNLEVGKNYRITDYVTTTSDTETRSAGHPFDLIVTAISKNKLSEDAMAIIHEGDTYFTKSKLEAWTIKYCLDNDNSRFDWADTTNGKGVIYKMIDEFDNDFCYDFKNIQFKRYKVTATTNTCNDGMIGQYLGWSDARNPSGNKPYGVTVDLTDFIWCYTFPYYSLDDTESRVVSRGKFFDCSLYQDTVTITNTYPIHVRNMKVFQYLNDNPNYRSRIGLNNIVFITYIDSHDFVINTESHHCTLGKWGSTVGTEYGLNYADKCFRNNILYGRCCHNRFSSCFESNTIGNTGENGSNCSWNEISESHFKQNCIGDYFAVNNIQGYFKQNVIGDSFRQNNIALCFQENKVLNTFVNNTLKGFTQGCIFGSDISYLTTTNGLLFVTIGGCFTKCTFENQIRAIHFTGGLPTAKVKYLMVKSYIIGKSDTNRTLVDLSSFTSKNGFGSLKLHMEKNAKLILQYEEINNGKIKTYEYYKSVTENDAWIEIVSNEIVELYSNGILKSYVDNTVYSSMSVDATNNLYEYEFQKGKTYTFEFDAIDEEGLFFVALVKSKNDMTFINYTDNFTTTDELTHYSFEFTTDCDSNVLRILSYGSSKTCQINNAKLYGTLSSGTLDENQLKLVKNKNLINFNGTMYTFQKENTNEYVYSTSSESEEDILMNYLNINIINGNWEISEKKIDLKFQMNLISNFEKIEEDTE